MYKVSAKNGALILLAVAITLALAMCDSGPQQMQGFVQHLSNLESERQRAVQPEAPISTLHPTGRFHIADVVWCGDNKTLVTSGGTDTSVLVWDAQRGEILRTLDRAAGSEAIACSESGRFIASGNSIEDQKAAVRVWDLSKSAQAIDIAGPFPTFEGGNDSFAKYLVFSSDKRRLYVHYVNRKREHRFVAYEVPTWKVASDIVLPGVLETKPILSARGNLYAYGFGIQDIAVIDPVSGAEKLRFHTEKVRGRVLAFSRENASIFVGGQRLYDGPHQGMPEQVVEEYSLENGKLVRSIVTEHLYELSGIALREHPDLLITASGDKTIELRNPVSGALVGILGDKTNQIHSIQVRPDGKQVATAGGVVNIWNLQ